MADPNKFEGNFLSLLDDFKPKRSVNKTVDGSSGHKQRNVAVQGEFSGGSNKDERACKNNPNRALHLKRQTTDKSRSSKEENLVKHNTIKPEEKISNEFFSILDSFDNKQAINKNQVVETEYKDYSCGTKEGKIHFVESDSKTSTRKNNFRPQNFRNEREIGLDNSKKDCISDRGRRPNISGNTDSTSMRNENIQENRETKIQEKRPRRTMGYKFLESLLNKDTSFVLTTLASPRSGFQELVDERPIRADLLMLIFKVLNKINESEAHQIKVQILSNTFRPEFIDELKKFVSQICVEENRMRLLAMNTFFVNVLNVLDTVANSLPTIMNDKFKSTLNALNLAMKSLREEHKINVSEQLFIQLKELTDQVSSYIEHSNKMNKEQRQHHLIKKEIPPPNNYRGLPLVPTEEDFMTDSYLRQNIVRGSYKDVDHYLDIQFRLLREDFIHPLREGILEYVMSLSTPQAKRRYSNVRIYPKVQFENPFKSRDVFGFYIQFDFEKRLPRNTNWEYNKRFMPGSLLLFTDNNFQSFYLATVVERKIEKLKEGLLFIQFVPGTDIPEYLVNPGVFFVMAESEVYYEAYKHVLSALQRMNEKNFPMKQYIVDVDTTCFPPAYLVDNSIYKISKFDVNLLDENSWPSPDELKLNPSQHQALKSALTNKFVVIQGPPGTGKTFLALKITEILLKNKVSPNTPIVVICYTNHALDQFLEGILKYTKSLIRIGMQSQNETLQKYTLEETRKRMNGARNTNYSALFRETRAEKLDAESKLLAVKANIEELTTTSKGILELQVLRSVVPPHQYNELIENHFLNWLFCYDDPEFRTKETSFVLLPEATDKTPETPEQLIKEAGNVTDVQGEAKDGTDNPGEDFEEIDEEESARRLADMKEDDFYDEDLFQDDYYVHSLSYSLTYDTIDRQIEMIREDCITRPHENSTSEYYFKLQCNELIEELIWQRNFLRKQFSRLGNFRFNRQRLEMFQQARSVWEINALDRWEYYYTWVYLYICQLKQVVQHFTKIYQDALMKLYELRQLEDLSFVQSAAVLGLTTSGAAKRRVLLENLGTKIVIVEEAAEVLEAHIVTSLAPTVQHVILIGDHKQLKPNPAVFKLAKKYNMDCSLFERMLNNGLGCSVLNEQHRMRPEIASLITPTIYPHLANHPSTLDRPRVRGVDRFIFFLSHNKPEDQMPDSTSKQNKHEADLLMELCKYLLLNDYKPEEITILATYIGQVWYMRKKKREMGEFMKAVRITPVDNFQGEENRIILLSLVRSNKENKIGFLSTENRVCVALSRAREGLYVVGNMDNLTNSSSIWPNIKQQLEDVNGFGQRLLLRCEIHPEQLTQVSHAKDFKAVPEGGCSLMCKAELDCGHICPRVCHYINRDHSFYKCLQKCERPPCDVEGHKCPLKCWQNCQPCVIRVNKQLLCGHNAPLKCHEEPAAHKCLEIVPAVHPVCKHEITKFCYLDVDQCSCTNNCSSRLPCGHACCLKCHINKDPDHLQYKCMKDCVKEYSGCPRKMHPCLKKCFEDCEPCKVPMPTTLPCGHHYEVPCSDDPQKFKCQRKCKKLMTCGHECKADCFIECDPTQCTVSVDKEAPCGHTMKKMKCNEPTSKRTCREDCKRTLPCGHPCTDKCCNDCEKVKCKVEIDSPILPLCGHLGIKIPCHLANSGHWESGRIELLRDGSDELLQLCKHLCGKRMICGHKCKGSCGDCLQGRLHVPCEEKCSKTLICGHECKSKCGELCPPCTVRNCQIQCYHKKCFDPQSKKNHFCYKLCSDNCNKRCLWKCEHFECKRRCWEDCDRPPCYEPCSLMLRCGHPCMGYCGERCPSVCSVCDADNPVTNNPGDRLVFLEDCEHIVSSKVMDLLVTNAIRDETLTFEHVRCPHRGCFTPIVNTLRYRSVYLRFRKQVVEIEETVKNNETMRLKKLHALDAELLLSDPTISSTMNVLMKICGQPFKQIKGNHSLDQKDMGRLVVGVLLQPLALRSEELQDTDAVRLTYAEKIRLRYRLEYLATALIKRVDKISYEAILQIEQVIANILRLTANDRTASSNLWYQITMPWTIENGPRSNQLETKPRLSATLRTRDITKQWLRCDKHHWSISENREACIVCQDEMEERRRVEEEKRQKEEREHAEQQNYQSNRGRGKQGPMVTDWRRGGGGRGRG